MKVFFHTDFFNSYNSDPAAEGGRMESVINAISPYFDICPFLPATEIDLLRVHILEHIENVRKKGIYDIAALAAGGTIQAAKDSINDLSFALICPPGHHATSSVAQGFCFFNNMAISVLCLHKMQRDKKIFILDFDYHFGNGTHEILKNRSWIEIFDIPPFEREEYLEKVEQGLETAEADIFAVSAGFDHHLEDIGRTLNTDDYYTIGKWIRRAVRRNNAACYGILEGGYNFGVLGESVLAFLNGMNHE